MPNNLHTAHDLHTYFYTTSPSSLISHLNGTLTHLRIVPSKQTHFPPSILIDAAEPYTQLVIPGLTVPVYKSYGDFWVYDGVWRVNSRRPLSQWVVVGLERVSIGEDPVVRKGGGGTMDCGGFGGARMGNMMSAKQAEARPLVEVNQWVPPPAPTPPLSNERVHSRESHREQPVRAPEMARADSETIGAGDLEGLREKITAMHIPVVPPPPPPHREPLSRPRSEPRSETSRSERQSEGRVCSEAGSRKLKEERNEERMKRLPTPPPVPAAAATVGPLADGYTDVARPDGAMADSLSESSFIPVEEDDESDRWSVLSTGPVDRQWTMLYEEKDEVV